MVWALETSKFYQLGAKHLNIRSVRGALVSQTTLQGLCEISFQPFKAQLHDLQRHLLACVLCLRFYTPW